MLKFFSKVLVLTLVFLNLSLPTFAGYLKHENSQNSQTNSSSSSRKTPARFVSEKVALYLEVNSLLGLFAGNNLNSPEQETILDAALDLNQEEHKELNETKISLALLPKFGTKKTSARKNYPQIVETMRLLHTVEATYQAGIGNGNFGNPLQLLEQELIDESLANALGANANTPFYGYYFKLNNTPAKKTALSTFTVVATAAVTEGENKTGEYSFFVDETGVIRVSKDPKIIATAKSEPLNEIIPPSDKQDFPFSVIILLETPNAKLTNKLTSFFVESVNSLLESNKVKIETSELPGSSSTIAILGLSDDIKNFLATINNSQFNPIANSPEFQRLQRTNDVTSNILVYSSGVALREIINSLELKGSDKANYEVASKLLGLAAVKATAFNFSLGVKTPSKFSAIVDKEQSGLLPMFASVALSDFHLAKFAPADSQIYVSFKLDPKLTYNSILQAIFPALEKGSDPLSTSTGINVNQDIIENLTGEFAISFSLVNLASLFDDKNPNKFGFKVAAIAETKNTEVFSNAFSRLTNFSSKEPAKSKPYKNTTISESKDFSITYTQNLALIGNTEGVQQTIDAITDNKTLAGTLGFQNTLKRFSPTGLGLVYLNLNSAIKSSPNFGKMFMVFMLGNFPSQLSLFAGRDKDELYIESSLGGATATALIGASMGAAIAIPNLLSARRSANGASAVETMRLIHSVEFTYEEGIGKGNFGTAEELFYQDLIDSSLADALGVKAMKSIGEQQCPGTGLPKSGYKFSIKVNKKEKSFTATASPVSRDGVSRTGDRSFFVDDTGVIRYTLEQRDANANDSPLGD